MGRVQGEHKSQRGSLREGAAALADVFLHGLRGDARSAGAGSDPDQTSRVRGVAAGRHDHQGGRPVGDLGHRGVEPLCDGDGRVFRGDRGRICREGSRGVMMTEHRPVMLEEAVAALDPKDGETVVDATFGGGGHARRILEKLAPGGKVVGIDRDPQAAERASGFLGDRRFSFNTGSYDDVLWQMVEEGERVDAILFDLGLSSFQIDEPERGFSYVREGSLDMRMDPRSGMSAAEFLNGVGAEELTLVLSDYGDVPRGQARRVAREVTRRRPLQTTTDLYEAVRAALGWAERGGNPAKRVLQAGRVRVNDELGGLERALAATERLLVPGGRLVVITFHSGEDRLVKRFISEREGRCVCPPDLPVCMCGAKPVFRRGAVRRPSGEEVRENPRSASARLRVAIRTAEPPEVGEDAS